MAPATRRSSGFGGQSLAQSNLDHILEHFNQFKRKHITQNRDIIKTNALAQLRIKELEDKVRALEAERTERDLDIYRLQQQLERVEQATTAVQRGWQLIGAGLAGLPSTSRAASLDAASSAGDAGLLASGRVAADEEALRALFGKSDAHNRPSARIVLDPNVLPPGVTRAIARPPEAEMQDIAEENSADITVSGEDGDATYDGRDIREDRADTGNMTLPEREDDINSNQVSFADDGDEGLTIGSTSYLAAGDETRTPNESLEESQLLQVPVTGGRHRKGGSAPGPSRLGLSPGVKAKKSADSLSSLGDEEMVQLSDDDDDENLPQPAGSQLPDLTRQQEPVRAGGRPVEETLIKEGEQVYATQASPSRRRSRRSSVVASPDTADPASSPEQSMTMDSRSGSESPTGTRGSRRLSMRDRRSVNYALPKLNTKMRKPDPVDLVPAKRDASRRSVSAPMRAKTGVEGDSSSAADDSPHSSSTADADGSQKTSIHKKPSVSRLRKGNGAASTGNLREIRRLHEQQSTNNAEDAGAAAIKQLSLQEEDVQSAAAGRSTAGTLQGESTLADADTTFSPQSTPDLSSNGFQDVFTEESDEAKGRTALVDAVRAVQPETEERSIQHDGRPAQAAQMTPASRAASQKQYLDLTSDLYGLTQSSAGTPIPKTGNRLGLSNGSNAGSIRAFKVAGRKGVPTSAPIGTSIVKQNRSNFMPVKTSSAASNGSRVQGSQGILTGSSRAANATHERGDEGPIRDAHQYADVKRNPLPHHGSAASLHAAMTSPAPTTS